MASATTQKRIKGEWYSTACIFRSSKGYAARLHAWGLARCYKNHNQVRVQPFLNGRQFKNYRAFISTRNTLPASVYKHPGIYKRSTNMTGQLYILFHKISYFLLIIPDLV